MEDDIFDVTETDLPKDTSPTDFTNVRIAVSKHGCLFIDQKIHPDAYGFLDYCKDSDICLNDLEDRIGDIPQEPGIYLVELEVVGDGPDRNGEYDATENFKNPKIIYTFE